MAHQIPERTIEFESLPEEYQQVLRLAQDRHHITVQPLQVLVGGGSGRGGTEPPDDAIRAQAGGI